MLSPSYFSVPEIEARLSAAFPEVPSPTPTARTRVPSFFSALAEAIPLSSSRKRVTLPEAPPDGPPGIE